MSKSKTLAAQALAAAAEDPHAWLDKYIAAQRNMHGDYIADCIRDAAEASEQYGDDALERFAAVSVTEKGWP